MGIGAFILSKLKQKAVYWQPLGDDGYGKMLFAEPVEIACRWEERKQVLGTITGAQVVGYQDLSRATVMVGVDLEEDGMLFLGSLTDLEDSEGDSSGGYYYPHDIAGTYVIKRFTKVPAVGSTTEFMRTAYLTPWLT